MLPKKGYIFRRENTDTAAGHGQVDLGWAMYEKQLDVASLG